ncbi:M15 family metallopeptidase [Treponema putidum]|uniref:D-alanyl-D-alanine carboxypeptidase family protein n=1 Tax=Treponema putidum TaxID=221027 RepID=A0AAE9SJS0_9SPIR|nr:M15 family metallopeptidase [Treponema putidum]UTY29393.1 D-alanyl-D-alanine carboxypeptidase family protein [Treponema putidum]UTY31883.1 D-alanyl-D-alanine carboxypeptidase family protein [Treponema putidum]UTY34246.1 D-alanyl-D-alanine carboxypeptidase family protein [Treponema putidum]
MYFNLKRNIFIILFFVLLIVGYTEDKSSDDEDIYKKVYTYISRRFPKQIFNKINNNRREFFKDLNIVLKNEKEDELILVDKLNRLDENYKPKNIILLVNIKDRKYVLDRTNIYLAKIAERPLQKMAEDAKKTGLEIMVSSGYRSYSYQTKLFSKYEKEYGKKNALSFSAPPGASQHQLGTVIDFGTIDDSYADTPEGKWMLNNAWKYGWSLSYPKNMEHITGYKWECWHYRYLGVEACKFQKEWFGDIQQYMLEFIDLWKKEKLN